MTRITFACGAYVTAHDVGDIRTGHLLGVFDSEAGMQYPRFADGKRAGCFLGCPCKKRAGYKKDRCFPSEPKLDGKVWRYVVSCKVVGINDDEKEGGTEP